MARAYSLDLRERVVAAVLRGMSGRAVAVLFGVGAASVVKGAQRARATGSPAARPWAASGPIFWRGRPLAAGPSRREARSDVAEALGRTRRARRDRVVRYPLALSAPGRVLVLKKASQRASKSVLASPAGVPHGRFSGTACPRASRLSR